MKTKFKLYKFKTEPSKGNADMVFVNRGELLWSNYWGRIVGAQCLANYARYKHRVYISSSSGIERRIYDLAFRNKVISNLLITAMLQERIDVP